VSDDDIDVDLSGRDIDLDNINFGDNNTIDDSETATDSFNDDNDITTTTDNDITTTTTNDITTTTIDDSYNEQSQVGDDSFDHQGVVDSFNEAETFVEPAEPTEPAGGLDPVEGQEPERL
jgi:hypothetical protein